VKAGELRHRVTLQSPVLVRNSSGQIKATSWADVATYRAEVTPLFGSEKDDGTQTVAVRNYQVKLRAGPAIDPAWRFSFQGRALYVTTSVETGERNRQLVVFCREKVNATT
jgi:SPP1 family predicted phage head-tail adaptor